jgi:hypothetical protein
MRRHIISTAAAGLLLAATGLAGCARPGAAAQSAGTGAGTDATVTSGGATEFYIVPAAVRTQDGTLYSHLVGAAPGSDRLIAQGTDATFVPASGAGAAGHLQWFSSASQSVAFADPSGSGSVDTISNMGSPLTSLDLGATRYAQVEGGVVAFSGGQVTATYPLPTLQPDPTVGGFPAGYKGVYTGVSTGQVTALVPTASGHVLAFTSTGLASAVTDLMTGRTVPLPGYGTLGSAVRTPSGGIAVLAWRGYQSSYPLHVVSLDGTSLGIGASMDTGLTPAGYLHDRLLGIAGHDAVLSVAHGDETVGVTLSVFSVDGNHLTPAVLPTGVGLEIAPGPAGSVYLFGGPAVNTVNQLDLATGALTRDVPALRAPTGAYVVGISA